MVLVVAGLTAVPVAMAGTAGTGAAAAPSVGQTNAQQQTGNVTIAEMSASNVSTTMFLQEATVNLQTQEGETVERTVENARVSVQDADMALTNATLLDDAVRIESAYLNVTSATIQADNPEINRSVDQRNFTVENRTVRLEDVTMGREDLRQMLEGATINEARIEGMSMRLEMDSGMAVAERQMNQTSRFVTGSVTDAVVDLRGVDMTIQDATVQDGTVMVGSAEATVGNGDVFVGRVFLLQGDQVTELTSQRFQVSDRTFTVQDVQVQTSELEEMLRSMMERMMGGGSASLVGAGSVR